jgi:hypothetical protein
MEPATGFSAAERERRWQETRQCMAAAGVEALVMPPGIGPLGPLNANQRNLCNVPDGHTATGAVFPMRGSPTLVLPPGAIDAGAIEGAGAALWADDVRTSEDGRFGAVLGQRLRELHLADAAIGIPYLDGGLGMAESPLAAGAIATLRAELPHARFVDATELMDEQRRVKSDEEIAAIECACGVADAAIFTLGYHIRAGMTQREALSILEAAILRQGSQPGHAARWICGPAPSGIPGPALPNPLSWGDVVEAGVAPRVAGYAGVETHVLCVGKPPERIYGMFKLALASFEAAVPLLTPGRSLDTALGTASEAQSDTPYTVTFRVADVGLAEETMDLTSQGSRALQAGRALAVKSIVQDADGITLSFCSTVAVAAEGGRRLARRPLELMLTSRSFLSAYTDWRAPEPTAPWLVGTSH